MKRSDFWVFLFWEAARSLGEISIFSREIDYFFQFFRVLDLQRIVSGDFDDQTKAVGL